MQHFFLLFFHQQHQSCIHFTCQNTYGEMVQVLTHIATTATYQSLLSTCVPPLLLELQAERFRRIQDLLAKSLILNFSCKTGGSIYPHLRQSWPRSLEHCQSVFFLCHEDYFTYKTSARSSKLTGPILSSASLTTWMTELSTEADSDTLINALKTRKPISVAPHNPVDRVTKTRDQRSTRLGIHATYNSSLPSPMCWKGRDI